MRIAAIVLLAVGVLALVYGGFTLHNGDPSGQHRTSGLLDYREGPDQRPRVGGRRVHGRRRGPPAQSEAVMNCSRRGRGAAMPAEQEMQMTAVSVMPMPPRALSVKAFGITDKGKVRTTNEDQFLIAELTKAMRVWQTSLPEPRCRLARSAHICFSSPTAWAGTRRANGRAPSPWSRSSTSRSIRSSGSLARMGSEAQKALAQFQSALSQADARIVEEAADHPELSGMGTTVTMAFHLGAQLCVVHVGDSRAYLYRDGELHQLTQDHTLMADMVRDGRFGQTRSPGTVSVTSSRMSSAARSSASRSKPTRSKSGPAIGCCCVRTDCRRWSRMRRSRPRSPPSPHPRPPRRSCSRRPMMAAPATTSRC